MQRKYNLTHFILSSVALLILTTLMAGVDAQAQIAFTSETNDNVDIYVIDADGQKPRQLTHNLWADDSLSWSPDGKRIAFSSLSNKNWDVYVMDADGGIPQKLTRNRHIDRDPSWSPDSKRIAFVSDRDGNWDIYVMNIDGKNPQNLTNSPVVRDSHPAWFSPAFSVAPAGKQFTMWGWVKQIAR